MFGRDLDDARVERSADSGEISQAEVRVHGEARRKLFTERQHPLITDDAAAGALPAVAGGQDQAEARRESGHALALFQ